MTSLTRPTAKVNALLEDFRRHNLPLPGRVRADGTREPDWPHIGRLLDVNYQLLERDCPNHRAVLDSGLPIDDDVYLRLHPIGQLDGQPWLTRIHYHQVETLARTLSTACFLVLSYLSGMRPGEALNLHRGCATHDPTTGLWQVHGRKWKNATDATGAKLPEGQHRDDPWIVADVVAHAITVLEQLHPAPLLFPVGIFTDHTHWRAGSRSIASTNDDLNTFLDWVNAYCDRHGRTDTIPAPPGRLTASQLRRTLAWFICRRPRGLVAAAIQYGHVHTQITQGYAGTYASGFPDDLAFERWLGRLDDLDHADRRLRQGEHISGPAADAYRSRVIGGSARFAGRVIRTGRQARHILANPSLQIHHGKGMTCVFNAATALCELAPSTDDARHTPDTDDCQPGCRNIARTDRDIDHLRAEADHLRDILDDLASPPLRHAREQRRLDHLETIIAEHENSQPEAGSR